MSGTSVLYREANAFDHMDSTIPNESGYTIEGGVGYGWTSQSDGMTLVNRGYDPSTGDHALLTPNFTLSGYTPEGFDLYGYPRWRTGEYVTYSNADFGSLAQTVSLTTSDGNLSLASNKLSGGALWSISWKGTQFVNQSDYGRLVQTSLFTYSGGRGYSSYNSNVLINPNPTEAGCVLHNGHTFGSPCVTCYNTNSTNQSSLSVPLEFLTDDFGGSDELPVIWSGMRLGKNLTISFGGASDAILYQACATIPVNISETTAHLVAPSIFANGNFSVYYNVNATTGSYTLQSLPAYQYNANFDPGAGGGIVISDPTTGASLGIYSRSPAYGGPVSDLQVWNIVDPNNPNNSASSTNSVALFAVIPGPFSAGTHTYTTFIVVGDNIAMVASTMHNINSAGY